MPPSSASPATRSSTQPTRRRLNASIPGSPSVEHTQSMSSSLHAAGRSPLLPMTSRGRPAVSRRTSSSTAARARLRSSTTRTRSLSSVARRLRAMPSASIASRGIPCPAPSMRRTATPAMTISPSTRSRVVPGLGETMARSRPRSAFNRARLPDIRRPRQHHRRAPRATIRPRRALASKPASRARDLRASPDGRGPRPSDLVLREVERHLEAGDQVEQALPQRAALRATGPRPPAGPPGAAARSVRAPISSGHRLGLEQIQPSVEVGAARELAGRGQPGAASHELAHDLGEHDRTAVAGQLDHVLARVGVRARA